MSDEITHVLTPVQTSFVTSNVFIRSTILNHHHIAIILSCKTDRVLASATNQLTKHGSIHAEVEALRQLHSRLRDRVVYTREVSRGVYLLSLRLNREGKLMMAKPCISCSKALAKCPLMRRVAWSDENGNIVYA